MEKSENKKKLKRYFPLCPKCEGLLCIKFNPLNFTVSYQCENNEEHNKNKIYFSTFNRYYLKEKENISCSSCNIESENEEFFKCKICNKIYCYTCLKKDNKDNGHMDYQCCGDFLKCKKHNFNFSDYCIDCKKNLCIYCCKESSQSHEMHKVLSYKNMIPSTDEINNIKNKIEEKTKYTENLIETLEQWKKEVINKIKELIEKLKSELELLNLMSQSFNNRYLNYYYLENYNYLNRYIKNINNEFLIKFNDSFTFEEKTLNMISVFKNLWNNNNNKTLLKDMTIKEDASLENDYGCLTKIKEGYAIGKNNNLLQIIYYDENKIKVKAQIELNEKITFISPSLIDNKIFIGLKQKKMIKILEYDLKKEIIDFNEKEIIDNDSLLIDNNKHFNKCIHLDNNYIVTSDSNGLAIWVEGNQNEGYLKIEEINLGTPTYDILLLDDSNFVSSQLKKKTLNFYSSKNFEHLKTIKDMDFCESDFCLFKIKDKYLVVNCKNGIGLIMIATKELVQYIEDESYISLQKTISTDYNGDIYILGKKDEHFNLLKVEMDRNNEELIQTIRINNISSKNNLRICCLNNGNIFIYGEGLYIWEKIK